MTVTISTGTWMSKFENGEYFGKELKERAYFHDNSISGLLHDLKELWKNNYGDGAAHPNLYYILLRAWSFDIKSGDFAWIKSRGIGLNLVFFALSFYATFILMTKIFSRHSFIVPLFLAIAFWNSAGVTNTIFVRPYALQEMLLLIFTLNCFVFYRLRFTSAKDAFKTHKFFFAWFIFATALLCLSHYFSLFFIAFAFIFLAIISHKNIFPLSVVVAFSFIIVQILYRDYFAFFNGYRAKESTGKLLLDNFWQNLNQTFSAGADIIATHFCNVYGLGILCVVWIVALLLEKKHIISNSLKSYKKIFIALSALAIFAYIMAFVLIALAKDNIQSASMYLDSINFSEGKSLTYTAKIAYKHSIFHARSKTASNLIIENIVWDNALDSSALAIKQIKNRYIDFSTTQDLKLDSKAKPQLGKLSYRVDFTPLLKIILRYYVVLLEIGFAIVLCMQYAKIVWSEEFKCDFAGKSILARESKSNAIFLFGFFIVSIVVFCLFLFVAPFKTLRYVMPIFPFLYFGVLLLLLLVKKPLLQGVLGIAFVASLFANYNVKELHKDKEFLFAQNPAIPVLVYLPTFSWQNNIFLYAFNDTQKYIAESSINHLKDRMREFERFYLISEKAFDTPLGYKQIVPQIINIGEEENLYFYMFSKNK